MKKQTTLACLMAVALGAQAQQGGISADMLEQIRGTYKHTAADKAIHRVYWPVIRKVWRILIRIFLTR